MNIGNCFGMQRLTSYQGISGTTFADTHLLSNRLIVVIELQILQASFQWLYGNVISEGRNRKSKLFSIKWEKVDQVTQNTQ